MNKVIIGLTAGIISLGVNAVDLDITIGGNDRLKKCRSIVKDLKSGAVNLSSSLREVESSLLRCQQNLRYGQGYGQVNELQNELAQANNQIVNLKNRISDKNDKIQDLKNQVQYLNEQLNPIEPVFDLADVMRACSSISSSSYAGKCVDDAKKYQVSADTVRACGSMSFSSSAAQCVEYAGRYATTTAQVYECLKINSSAYASQCVADAGNGNVPVELISACVETNVFASNQSSCVKDSSSR